LLQWRRAFSALAGPLLNNSVHRWTRGNTIMMKTFRDAHRRCHSIIAAAITPSLLVARQNVLAVESFASRCHQQAKAPPGESGAFWGSKDWGDRPASRIRLSTSAKGSKQQRRQSGICSLGGVAVETGYAIPQYQYVCAAWKRFNGPKGLRGRGANSRPTCGNEKTRP